MQEAPELFELFFTIMKVSAGYWAYCNDYRENL